ncbi:desiccation-related protein PCC13-62-like [Prunus dulcis]|uniref:desiccation-related protein PCC13-62-like n=1 Tax=Prunus dulcis TaxID=3755 RepID=UPI001482E797|nr:desiccation-related protein PCC13-62-like [Prunus dulcis]
MATSISYLAGRPALVFVVALLEYYLISLNHLVISANSAPNYNYCRPIEANDTDLIQFALNLEFLEAEFFLYGALGEGLDAISPNLALGGPPPIGGHKANLNPLVAPIIQEFGYQEVGHLRAIITTIGGFPRPLLNLSRENFAALFDQAAGFSLTPPFDPYANSVNFLLASYAIPYVGLVGYVGTIPNLTEPTNRRFVASLLGVEAGQDAVIRALLYKMAHWKVFPYRLTVADFTNLISGLRNKLGGCGIKDEGIIVPETLGAENRTCSNVLSADLDSLSYARTQPEILRIVYATGDESVPGGFYPRGANGNIARRFLNEY